MLVRLSGYCMPIGPWSSNDNMWRLHIVCIIGSMKTMSHWLCSNLLHWLSLYIFTLLYNTMLNCSCRILVGVPNGTTTGHQVDRTGYVLECPLSPGPCEPLRGSGEGNDTLLYDETSGLPMTNFIGRCLLYRPLPNIHICIHITFFLHIYFIVALSYWTLHNFTQKHIMT